MSVDAGRMADVERDETCHAAHTDTDCMPVTVRSYECSACGKSWETVWAEGFAYCPYCGRRIENGDE